MRRRVTYSSGEHPKLLRKTRLKWHGLKRAMAGRKPPLLIGVSRFASMCAVTLRICQGAKPPFVPVSAGGSRDVDRLQQLGRAAQRVLRRIALVVERARERGEQLARLRIAVAASATPDPHPDRWRPREERPVERRSSSRNPTRSKRTTGRSCSDPCDLLQLRTRRRCGLSLSRRGRPRRCRLSCEETPGDPR